MPINKSSYYPKTLVWLASLLSAWKSTAHNFYKPRSTNRKKQKGRQIKSNQTKERQQPGGEGKERNTPITPCSCVCHLLTKSNYEASFWRYVNTLKHTKTSTHACARANTGCFVLPTTLHSVSEFTEWQATDWRPGNCKRRARTVIPSKGGDRHARARTVQKKTNKLINSVAYLVCGSTPVSPCLKG